MSEYSKCPKCQKPKSPLADICADCQGFLFGDLKSKLDELIEQYIDMGETAVVPVHEIIGDLQNLIKGAEGKGG